MLGGICSLIVIIELILPQSSTNKYIKSIAAVFMVIAIISPIPSLIKNIKFSIDSNNSLILDENFLIDINDQKRKLLEKNIQSTLKIKDINVDVTLSVIVTSGEPKYVYATVYVNSFSEDEVKVVGIIKNVVKQYVSIDSDNISVIFGGKNE